MTARLWVGLAVLAALTASACGSAPTVHEIVGHGQVAMPSATPATTAAGGAAPTAQAKVAKASATPSPQASPSPARAPVAGTSPKPVAAPAGTVVSSWNSPTYGQILVDSRGHVLYLFTPDDASGTPNCTGSCAATWPPFDPKNGAPRAQGAVQQSLLATNSGQITYNGHPLYFYAPDTGADQANGQCSGQIWYVIGVDGNAVLTPCPSG